MQIAARRFLVGDDCGKGRCIYVLMNVGAISLVMSGSSVVERRWASNAKALVSTAAAANSIRELNSSGICKVQAFPACNGACIPGAM